jgi:hypothetical protein
MSQRVDKMVESIRRLTHTNSYTDSPTSTAQRGLQTQTIVDLLNEALEVVHGILYDNGTQAHIKEALLNIAADTEAVTISTDAFLGVNVLNVEFKYGSGSNDYRKLKKISEHERDTRSSGDPLSYVHRKNEILLSPIRASALTSGLRVTYEHQLPTVDVRRGKVSAVDDGDDPTSITIAANGLATAALSDSDLVGTYISVVDKDGNIQMQDIPVTAYDTGTGVITLGTFTSSSSEVVAVNDYVVIGSNASTHLPFPRSVEPFVIEYVKRNIYDLNGDPMINASERKLIALQFRLESMFAEWSSDIKSIPELDIDRFI